MKTLYDLAKLTQKHSKIINALVPSEKESPLHKLNSLLVTQNDLDDSEAMVEIYGRKNLAAFSRLKSRLKEILMRGILLQNINMEAAESRVNEAHNQYRYVCSFYQCSLCTRPFF